MRAMRTRSVPPILLRRGVELCPELVLKAAYQL
jgi:hypothetical protein